MSEFRDGLLRAMAEGPNPMFFKGNRENALMVAEDMLDAGLNWLAVHAEDQVDGIALADHVALSGLSGLLSALREEDV